MKIIIESVPTRDHRYPTAGDYWIEPDGTLHFRVSEELDWKHQVLLLIHEMVEAFQCINNGPDFDTIDEYDKAFEKRMDLPLEAEPGDMPGCPYRQQHRRAENIERLMADFMGVHWDDYTFAFEQVCKLIDEEKAKGRWAD